MMWGRIVRPSLLLTLWAAVGGAALAQAAEPPVQRPGRLLDGGGEGRVVLHDAQGRWFGVAGFSALTGTEAHAPLSMAIIDSGILAEHPQIRGLVTLTKDFTGEGIADRLGHGTVVAILAARSAETALPGDRFLPPLLIAKVAYADGSIAQAGVIDAIDWAAQHHAMVVSMSLGFREGTGDYSTLCAAIARHADTLFSVAAGNFGPQVKVYPAACGSGNIIAVAATEQSEGKTRIAPYSGKGDIAAPGTVAIVPLTQ